MTSLSRALQLTALTLCFGTGLFLTLPATASTPRNLAPVSLTKIHHSAKVSLSGKININTASQAQLQLLPGVGPKKASRIVGVRKLKAYRRPQDLVKVKGIGRKTVKKLMPYLAVSGQTTLARK